MFAGSTVLSTVGFGIGMTTIPIMLFAFDPQTVVVVVNAVSIALFVLIVHQNRADIPVRRVLPWAGVGLLAAPVGVLILRDADTALLKVAIATAIIALTVVVASGARLSLPSGTAVGLALAFAVSLMLNALGIGGPIMALHAFSYSWTRNAVRGALSLYFLFVEAFGVIGYGLAGMLSAERLWLIAIVTIPVLLGFALATKLVRRMSETVFRRASVLVILFTSGMVLAREVSGIL